MRVTPLLAAAFVIACAPPVTDDGGTPPPDAGANEVDAGRTDPDAGPSDDDAGLVDDDAGAGDDAGVIDAGGPPVDAGAGVDAGVPILDGGGSDPDGGAMLDGGGTDAGLDPFADEDRDTISDLDEGRALLRDSDDDDVPDWLDDDSDDDCIVDALEAGDADLATPPVDTDGDGAPDAADGDADDDRVADALEDPTCDGVLDDVETDRLQSDTDGDGTDDLVEQAVGTDPRDALSSPDALGLHVLRIDGTAARSVLVEAEVAVVALDVYVLLDWSSSMSGETTAIKNNLAAALHELQCEPGGTGDPATCIPDLWAGAGAFGYAASTTAGYTHAVDLRQSPSFASVPTTEPDGCCNEATRFAVWESVTGAGSAASGCTLAQTVAARSCSTSPAGVGGIGHACFRSTALRTLIVVTDEGGAGTLVCPADDVIGAAAQGAGVRVAGINASGTDGGPAEDDLVALALVSSAVDGDGAPLVVDGKDSAASNAVRDLIARIAATSPMDVRGVVVDDPSDAVDAAAFVDQVVVVQDDACENGAATIDSDADELQDSYVGVVPGMPVCWRVDAKATSPVAVTSEPQAYRVVFNALETGGMFVAAREVVFVVPPAAPVP